MGFRGGGQIDPPPLRFLVFKYPSRDRVKKNFFILKVYKENENLLNRCETYSIWLYDVHCIIENLKVNLTVVFILTVVWILGYFTPIFYFNFKFSKIFGVTNFFMDFYENQTFPKVMWGPKYNVCPMGSAVLTVKNKQIEYIYKEVLFSVCLFVC